MAIMTVHEALPAPYYSGKVRDLHRVGDDRLLIVASDRMSAFDVILPTAIPDKGRILTALSLWWFDQLRDVVDNHVISADPADYPAPFTGHPDLAGRSMLVRRLDMVKVECVARAYLSGSGTTQYERTGAVCGVPLPPGLVEGSRLPETIFTPTTKGTVGQHDEPITYRDVVAQEGDERAAELRRLTIAVLNRGIAVCEPRGIILADTKVEFGTVGGVGGADQTGTVGGVGGADQTGTAPDGRIILADEVLTPDSARFWPADEWEPGHAQPSYDKQHLRDWLTARGWDKTPPGPDLPDELVAAIRGRYVEAYEKITGRAWAAG
jgi:phosphoribosylaminoimidazole-succinocarboxamide synthase